MTYHPVVSQLERVARGLDAELLRKQREVDEADSYLAQQLDRIAEETRLVREAVGRANAVLVRERLSLAHATAELDDDVYGHVFELSDARAVVESSAVEVERASMAGGLRRRRHVETAADALAEAHARAEAIAKRAYEQVERTGRERRDSLLGDQREAVALLRSRELPEAVAALDRVSLPWEDPRWAGYDGLTNSDLLRLGDISRTTPIGRVTVPVAASLPLGAPYNVETDQVLVPQARQGMTALGLRLLVSQPAGSTRLVLIDPVGLGSAFGALLRMPEELYGGKVWTDPRHIEEQLSALTDQIERVTQRCLRNEYADIGEYNRAAGELAEPCFLVLVADFPVNFTPNAALALQRIVEQGPRCGVAPVVHLVRGVDAAFGVDPSRVLAGTTAIRQVAEGLELQDWPGWRFSFEQLPSDRSGDDLPWGLLDRLGPALQRATTLRVPFARVLEQGSQELAGRVVGALRTDGSETWWQSDPTDELVVPIGRAGADDLCFLRLNDRTPHALVVGRTGMGKSNLFNVIVTGLALQYSPHDVEFYAIDFREGVTQSDFAEHRLPHARVLALETVREFGLSVLRGLREEMAERGGDYRRLNVDQYPLYRRAGGTKPRVVLIVDEFHALFSPPDEMADEAVRLLADLVQQGRGFGIHVVLASQDLNRTHTFSQFDQLQTRVVFACEDRTARAALRHDNDGAAHLTRPGEAIFNDVAGLIAGNRKVQIAALERDDLRLLVDGLRRRAVEVGFTREPRVFEGGRRPVLEDAVMQGPGTAPAAWVGEPAALAPPVEIAFRQQAGNNLLVVSRDAVERRHALLAVLAGLRRTSPEAEIHVVDCSAPSDDWVTNPLTKLLARSPVATHRASDLPGILEKVHQVVSARVDGEPVGERIFLLLDDLKGARALDAESGWQADADTPTSFLNRILADGPSVEVWVVATAETVRTFERRVSPTAHRDFSWRLISPVSLADSLTLINSDAAARLREGQALLANVDDGTSTVFLPYSIRSLNWLESAVGVSG